MRATPAHIAFSDIIIRKVYGPAIQDILEATHPSSMAALADDFNDTYGTGITATTAREWLEMMGYSVEYHTMTIASPKDVTVA